jgi:hypothetical protein
MILLGSMAAAIAAVVSCGGDDPVQTDTTPPTVAAIYPDDGAENIRVGATVSVTFSEEIDQSTVNDSTFVVEGVNGTIMYSNKIATFTPASDLDVNTGYTIVITTAVSDLAGNHLARTFISSFTTGDVFFENGSSYFPMSDGDTWYYTDASNRKIVRAVQGDTVIITPAADLTPIERTCTRVLENDTTTECWSIDSIGFNVHLLDKVLSFEPPLVIPFGLALEESYLYDSKVYITENDTLYEAGTATGSLKFKGYITHTVSAGQFDSVAHFLYLTDGYSEYYAKGVGLLDNDDYVLDSAFVGGIWYRP